MPSNSEWVALQNDGGIWTVGKEDENGNMEVFGVGYSLRDAFKKAQENH